MKFMSMYLVGCIFASEILGISATSHYYDGLIQYLKEVSKLHQVLFILDDRFNNMDSIMNSLMPAISLHFPSLSVTYTEIRSKLKSPHLMFLKKPRSTTLFVLEWTRGSTVKEVDFFFFKNDLLVGSPKPRCLVVNSFLSTEEDVRETLDLFWQNKYLDVTLLTHSVESEGKIETSSDKSPLLSHFNPFTNNYSTRVVSAESQWFPDKLLDLNKQKLNFTCALANDSYEAECKKMMKFSKVLAQGMNFDAETVPLVNPDCQENRGKNKSEIKKFVRGFQIKNKEIDPVISGTFGTFNSNYSMNVRNLRILKLNSVKVVIPQTAILTEDVQVSSEFWYMILGTFGTIAVIRITAFFFKFKKRTWQTLNISQIIIGMSTDHEPENWMERFAFGSLLIACIVYSGYFYSVIVDISFRSTPEISTLAELVKSRLTSLMTPAMKNLLINSKVSDIQKMSKRSEKMQSGMSDKCLELLARYKNVTCVFENAENTVNKYEAKFGEIDAKILQETLGYTVTSFWSKPFSPYIDHFNKIILKAAGFGLLKEFYLQDERLHSNASEPEFIKKEELLFVLFCVSIIGYSISIAVFLFEVISTKLKSKFCTSPNFSL